MSMGASTIGIRNRMPATSSSSFSSSLSDREGSPSSIHGGISGSKHHQRRKRAKGGSGGKVAWDLSLPVSNFLCEKN